MEARTASLVTGEPGPVAYYDLGTMPTTYDFAPWLVIAKTVGARHVRFAYRGEIQTTKYPAEIAWRRFANILIPMCKFAGMDWDVKDRADGFTNAYAYGHVLALYRSAKRVEKLKASFAIDGYTTITLRNSRKQPWRNSNETAWAKFEEYLKRRGKKVMIFPDCEDNPIHLDYRMAVYAGAEMNLGASGGPMALCHFSDAPYLTYNMVPRDPKWGPELERYMTMTGFPPDTQMPFRTQRQRLVWKPDDYDTIREEYERMCG